MIEVTVLNYLESKLPELSFSFQVPEDPPAEYVVIQKTGSGIDNHIHSATFAIQSYAKTLFRAAAINEVVKELMDNIIELGEIAASTLNSDYNFTDTRTKVPRYQAVYNIIHY